MSQIRQPSQDKNSQKTQKSHFERFPIEIQKSFKGKKRVQYDTKEKKGGIRANDRWKIQFGFFSLLPVAYVVSSSLVGAQIQGRRKVKIFGWAYYVLYYTAHGTLKVF